jgi:glycine cleavage system aminomethyltransferase T
VALDKGVEFKGQRALKEYKAKYGATPPRRLVSVTFANPDAYPLGDEPLYRDNKLLGYLSSASWGHSIGRGVGLAYLSHPEGKGIDKSWLESAKYEVEIHGTRWEVQVSLQAPYDPKSLRVKM